MTKRNGGNNTAINTGLNDTRARLAWSTTRRPSLVRALARKESFEKAKELVLRAYVDMLRARLVDQKAIALYKQNKSFFQIGVAGHEAIQVAAAMHFDKDLDYFFPYYRGMAFCAALGMTNETFMLNCMSKAADPNSHGRQMPMHYGEKRLHIPSQSSVVATQFLAATGCALALKLRQEDGIVYVSSGDGGCCEGDFHECLSWASKDRLPLIIVIENNEYAISTPLSDLIGAKSPFELGQGYSNLKRMEVDGTDFFESYDVMQEACSFARSGEGPVLIDAHVV
ncbi:MAG: thiamine pyrophosphate-dependent dehydrogenase E1 component subunit alpha, partial [SAR324 cluster bacterium]|nr:thiamine pyrophosphate-dependent dehydrogenase E1 component subunit alpha [SAR324 cluster bacterium]